MAFRKEGGEELNGYLGPGSEIEGTVRFASVLRVDGKISGKVISQKELIVGQGGIVDADVEVGSISVAGNLSGTITVRDRMEVHAGARVRGEIRMTAPRLVIEDGAIFEGTIRMGEREPAEAKDEPPIEASRLKEIRAGGGAGGATYGNTR